MQANQGSLEAVDAAGFEDGFESHEGRLSFTFIIYLYKIHSFSST
jgi:hypothetical protein